MGIAVLREIGHARVRAGAVWMGRGFVQRWVSNSITRSVPG